MISNHRQGLEQRTETGKENDENELLHLYWCIFPIAGKDALLGNNFYGSAATAQHSVHPTGGYVPRFQAVFWAQAGSVKMA